MKLFILIISFFISGCANISITSFDKGSRVVVISGSNWASDEDFENAAKKVCNSENVSLIGMSNRTVGSRTSFYGNGTSDWNTYGNNGYGSSNYNGTFHTQDIKRYDRTFRCPFQF